MEKPNAFVVFAVVVTITLFFSYQYGLGSYPSYFSMMLMLRSL